MKWLVLWTMIQLVPTGCPERPDPYGRMSTGTLAVACMEYFKHDGSREFFTFEEAFAFMEHGELTCDECRDWRLEGMR